ncbi:hypothetical protein GLYMA_07G224302v4 [Glycine max]|nr:hypothetical protein GLYMA_07G224302v4 [Glycine max]KAH1088106.1 hypothetical protein GYH30_019244 [Glycine max]
MVNITSSFFFFCLLVIIEDQYLPPNPSLLPPLEKSNPKLHQQE